MGTVMKGWSRRVAGRRRGLGHDVGAQGEAVEGARLPPAVVFSTQHQRRQPSRCQRAAVASELLPAGLR